MDAFYGDFQALFGVSLAIKEGETVAIVGANGAGKSTLLKTIMGIVPVNHGQLLFAGNDITTMSVPQRNRMGLALVPEGRQILTSLSVHENLLMGAYPRRQFNPRETDAIYDRFPNLADRRDMLASVLSGGEQQMLATGRALLAKPR